MDFGTRAERVGNLAVVPGQRAINQVYRVDVTDGRETTIGPGERASRPREAAAQGRR